MTGPVPIAQREFEPHPWRVPLPRRLQPISKEELTAALEQHRTWVQYHGEAGARLVLIDRDLTGAGSIHCHDLHGACFAGCRLAGVELSVVHNVGYIDFTNADLRGAIFRANGSQIPGWSFSGARGFSGRDRLRVIERGPELHQIRTALFEDLPRGNLFQRFVLVGAPGWDSIRSLGDLPLFGISYVALSGVLIYAAGARWYNRQIETIHGLASDFPESHPDAPLQFLSGMASRLHDAPRPWGLGALLLGLLLLAVGSTWYKVRCPTIIQHYRLPQWEESGRDGFLWHGQNWSYYWTRKSCSILYGVGGIVTLAYLVPRVVAAVRFFAGA